MSAAYPTTYFPKCSLVICEYERWSVQTQTTGMEENWMEVRAFEFVQNHI